MPERSLKVRPFRREDLSRNHNKLVQIKALNVSYKVHMFKTDFSKQCILIKTENIAML
jgi:hypothetical protein